MSARKKADKVPSTGTPIIPKNSIAGQALIAVIAIMTFLASLTTGAVMLVLSSAADWQSEVAREMTIQIRPIAGRDLEAAGCDRTKAGQRWGGAHLHRRVKQKVL